MSFSPESGETAHFPRGTFYSDREDYFPEVEHIDSENVSKNGKYLRVDHLKRVRDGQSQDYVTGLAPKDTEREVPEYDPLIEELKGQAVARNAELHIVCEDRVTAEVLAKHQDDPVVPDELKADRPFRTKLWDVCL